MARDYAHQRRRSGSSAARRPAASGGSGGGGMPGWVWLALGLAIGLVVAAFVYISRGPHVAVAPPQNGAAASSGAPSASQPASQSSTPVAPPAGGKQQIPLPPKQPSRFSFYEMLPSYEVVIPSADAAAAAKSGKAVTPDIAAPGQYLIQVGAYRTREEADKGRASLALLGVESRIEQVTIDQTNTWYRVRIGPEASLQKAQSILERLDDNGIKGMLIKVKSG